MRFLISACIGLAALTAPTAYALDPGTVTHLRTEPGTVLVLRGNEVFVLKEGDAVFVGDRIFTRTYGAVRFTIGDCSIGLGGQQSFQVGEDACSAAPINLAGDAVIGGIEIGGVNAGAGGGLGATPTLIGLLLAGGGAAAAAAANDGGSPASP